MKKLLLIGCLALAGCGTTGSISTTDISDRAKQIQDYTKTFCKFVPTIGTIAAILSKGASASIIGVATDICTAVTTAPLADGGPRVPRVNGVAIKGKWVR